MFKVFAIAALGFISCSEKSKSEVIPPQQTTIAEDPICHLPLKIRKEATRIVFTDCDGNETELKFAEITGPAGKPGERGESGPSGGRGPAGQNAPEEKAIAYCRHDPVTHRNHTMQLKPSEIVTKFAGFYGAQDFPKNCGETEGTCPCDSPVCNNPNPQVGHYFYGPEHD